MKLNFLYANMQKDIDSVEKELKRPFLAQLLKLLLMQHFIY